jgi:hypothetical protein
MVDAAGPCLMRKDNAVVGSQWSAAGLSLTTEYRFLTTLLKYGLLHTLFINYLD